jgi:hypothetical protein
MYVSGHSGRAFVQSDASNRSDDASNRSDAGGLPEQEPDDLDEG